MLNLTQGKWYKFFKQEPRDHWNFVSPSYFISRNHCDIVKYYYNTPILFLEELNKYHCLKFFYNGKIICCDKIITFDYEEIK